jgi:PAS domain S-box-containing protein
MRTNVNLSLPLLFEHHPDPMWIYATGDLRILAVNEAAVRVYGYPREQFLSLTLHDLRDADQRAGLDAALAGIAADGAHRAGVFQHRKSTGERLIVEVTSSPIQYGGQDARLVVARDISRIAALEAERLTLLETEKSNRRRAEGTAVLFQSLFEAVPGKFLVLDTQFNIVAASNDYLQATMCRRESIVGKALFDVFPDDPAEPAADGVANVRASLERVMASGEADVMPLQRYPIRTESGSFVERFWAPVNMPVRLRDEIEYIIHRAEDVTEIVRGGVADETNAPGRQPFDILVHLRALEDANQRLRRGEAMLRIAGRIARMGGWSLDAGAAVVEWSPEACAIHAVPAGTRPTAAEALAFFDAEDQPRVRHALLRCMREQKPFDELARIRDARGRPAWVRVIGEPEVVPGGEVRGARGAVQDVSELVEARQASEALLRRLTDALESTSDAVAMLDGAWKFTFLNQQALGVLRHGGEQLIGRSMWTAFPHLEAPLRDTFERVVRSGRAAETRFQDTVLSAWIDLRAYPTREGLAVYFRDVTKERATQEELLLLQSAVDRQSDILVITDAAGQAGSQGHRILYVNEAFERRTGWRREEVIGRSPGVLNGPATSEEELRRIESALATGEPMRTEILRYTKAGETFWAEFDLAPITDGQGRRTHWVTVQRDATDRMRAEQQARISEERFELLARATNDVIWDWDFTTDHIWWNEAYEQVFGHSRAHASPGSRSWTDHIHPDDVQRVVAGIREIIDGSGSNWRDEYRFLAASGDVLDVIDRGFLIRDAEGRAVRMLGSMVDVTNLRRLEAQLRQSQRLDAIGQLTGGVAHDFNNLLTVILGNSEVLSEALARDPRLGPLAEMNLHAAVRGAELTSRLLAFGRKQALMPRPTDIAGVLANLHDMLRRTLGAHIDIQCRAAEGAWPALVDPAQLEAAILNLCLNARDAMPEGGVLAIEVRNETRQTAAEGGGDEEAAGDYVVIEVRDTGTGMDERTLGRAFEPFFTTKEVGKGSGLGLSMVYGFARQSHGHVRIESQHGKGTTVILSLPRASQAPRPG